MVYDAVQNSWVDGLEQFLTQYGVPASIASVVAVLIIIGIPTFIQMLKLMQNAKDNSAYRGIMLTRIISSAAYSKQVAEATKRMIEEMKAFCERLSQCKRLSEVKELAKESMETIQKEADTADDLIETGTTMVNEYGTVPSKRALKEMEKSKEGDK